jgi:hypothetical protein
MNPARSSPSPRATPAPPHHHRLASSRATDKHCAPATQSSHRQQQEPAPRTPKKKNTNTQKHILIIPGILFAKCENAFCSRRIARVEALATMCDLFAEE